MSAIKFRKRLTKFKITITLPKKFVSKGFITVVKVTKIEEALAKLIIKCLLPNFLGRAIVILNFVRRFRKHFCNKVYRNQNFTVT